MRQQVGLTLLVAASVAFAFLAVVSHVHGLRGVRADDNARDASPLYPSFAVVCSVCTLVHVSPAPTVDCVPLHVPCVEQRLKQPDTATLPSEPALCSHASRAPPAHRGFGA